MQVNTRQSWLLVNNYSYTAEPGPGSAMENCFGVFFFKDSL